MSEKIWRGGMIGAGAWSAIQLIAWEGVPDARIVALTDRHPDRRDPIVKRFGIEQAYDDFETMLDEADLNFVDICTRPYSHAALIRMAADRGLPILCQKPFCTNLEEARASVAYCQQRGVRLMVNENYRWQAWFRKIKALLQAGALGTPFLAQVHQRVRLTLPRFEHDQAYMATMPRLIVYEMGVHFLDTFRFLFGEPNTIFARLHHVSPHIEGEEVQVLTVNYDEMTALIVTSWASVPTPGDRPKQSGPRAPRLEIDGTAGTLALKADNSLHLYTDTGHQQWQFPEDTVPKSHVAAQRHFIVCLEDGAEFETSGLETLQTMALVYASYQSAESGDVLDLKSLF